MTAMIIPFLDIQKNQHTTCLLLNSFSYSLSLTHSLSFASVTVAVARHRHQTNLRVISQFSKLLSVIAFYGQVCCCLLAVVGFSHFPARLKMRKYSNLSPFCVGIGSLTLRVAPIQAQRFDVAWGGGSG